MATTEYSEETSIPTTKSFKNSDISVKPFCLNQSEHPPEGTLDNLALETGSTWR